MTASIVVTAEAFHGTQGGFVELDHDKSGLGTHFGTWDAADDRSINKDIKRWEIRRYDLDIKNPLWLYDIDWWNNEAGVAQALYTEGVITKPEFSRLLKISQSKEVWTALRQALERAGYDSVGYTNDHEDPGQESYIVWDSSKIKYLGLQNTRPKSVTVTAAEKSEQALKLIASDLAKAAQQIYDAWDVSSDEEVGDSEVGFGGICHLIAEEMAGIIAQRTNLVPVTVTSTHEQHVYVVAQGPDGVFEIDIPYRYYETGGGFSWQKLPDVVFDPSMISIYQLSRNPKDMRQYVEDWEESEYDQLQSDDE